MDRDRLIPIRRAMLVVWSLGAIAIGIAVTWAARVEVSARLPDMPVPNDTSDATRVAFDVGASIDAAPPQALPGFAGRFSPRPPEVARPPTPVASEAPIAQKIQLLGIARDGDQLVAALYDASDDRVHLVRDGEAVGDLRVRRVDSRSVVLAKGDRTRSLILKNVAGGGPSE